MAPLFTRPNPGLGAARIGEHALGILRRGGLEAGAAVAAFSGVIALNYGWSSFKNAPALDAGYGSDDHYDFVLDRLLGGLAADERRGRRGAPSDRVPRQR